MLNTMITRRPSKKIKNDHVILCECQECLSNQWFSDIQSRNRFLKISERKMSQRWVDLDKTNVLALWHICRIPVHLEKPDDIAYRFAEAISFALREVNYRAFCFDATNDKEYQEIADERAD